MFPAPQPTLNHKARAGHSHLEQCKHRRLPPSHGAVYAGVGSHKHHGSGDIGERGGGAS